jgi:hypothetical protein
MPQRNVVPKPVQRPHPPLWVACSRRETIRLAARKGIGALSFSFVEPEEAKEWVDEYHAILASEDCVPGGFEVNPNFAVVLPMMCARDEEEAIERGIDGAHFFGYALAHYYVFGDHRPGRTNIYEEFLRRREEVGFARSVINADDGPLGVRVLQHGLGSLRGAIGTPGQIRELVQRYEAAGVDQVIFCLQAGRNRHDHICEALELFAAEVLPGFAGRAGEVEAAKRERLAPAIDAALLRREPPRVAGEGHVIAPTASGLSPSKAGGGTVGAEPARNGSGVSSSLRTVLQNRLQETGEQAFRTFVRRAGDRRLEQTAGSARGLGLLFAAMAQQFRPDKAGAFSGELQWDLRRSDGRTVSWTIAAGPEGAKARPGAAAAPALVTRMSVVDFLRVAGRQLDPGKALLTGRLDLEGDFALASRLGEMFGQASAL